VANTVSITVDADTSTAEANVKGMGAKFGKALKGVAMAAGGITLAAGAAAKLGQEYQEATNTIAAGTGATGEALEGLTESFKDVWATVPQDAATVASAIADINTEFGFTGEKLETVTELMLTASRAMGEDLGGIIKSTADLLVGFGEDKGGAEKLLDKLTVAAQFSGSSMQGLADKVINFAPQLQAMGLGMDESIALIANMDAAGMSASKMMPGLNTAIKKLSSEGVTDISAGLEEAIGSIQNAGTDAEGLGIAMDLFGAGAGLRFQAAIKEGVFDLDDLIATMDNSGGTLETLGKDTLTMSEKFDIMKNKVKATLSPIGSFATALGPMVIMIPALVTGISAMAGSQVVATVATYAQAAAMAVLNIAMGPIGLIILGIVVAVVAAIAIFKNWDKIMGLFKKGWDTVWKGMKAVVVAIANPIIGIINAVIGAVNGLFDAMKKVELGWAEKKIGIGKFAVTVPGVKFAPFAGLPTIPKIPELAAGGIVRSPTLAMLGEAGPEAVVPLGRGGMGGGVTINILGPTYGFDDFEERVAEAISDGVRRGGFSGILAPA